LPPDKNAETKAFFKQRKTPSKAAKTPVQEEEDNEPMEEESKEIKQEVQFQAE